MKKIIYILILCISSIYASEMTIIPKDGVHSISYMEIQNALQANDTVRITVLDGSWTKEIDLIGGDVAEGSTVIVERMSGWSTSVYLSSDEKIRVPKNEKLIFRYTDSEWIQVDEERKDVEEASEGYAETYYIFDTKILNKHIDEDTDVIVRLGCDKEGDSITIDTKEYICKNKGLNDFNLGKYTYGYHKLDPDGSSENAINLSGLKFFVERSISKYKKNHPDAFIFTLSSRGNGGVDFVSIPLDERVDMDFWVDWDFDGVFDEHIMGNDFARINHKYSNKFKYDKVEITSRPIAIKGKSICIIASADQSKYHLFSDNIADPEWENRIEYSANQSWLAYKNDLPMSMYTRIPKITIEQWGTIPWESFRMTFARSDLKINATDAPNLSKVKFIHKMFERTTFLNKALDLTKWDFSNVECVRKMFAYSQGLQYIDLSSKGLDNVKNFSGIFASSDVLFVKSDLILSSQKDKDFSFIFGMGTASKAVRKGREETTIKLDFKNVTSEFFSYFYRTDRLLKNPKYFDQALADLEKHPDTISKDIDLRKIHFSYCKSEKFLLRLEKEYSWLIDHDKANKSCVKYDTTYYEENLKTLLKKK